MRNFIILFSIFIVFTGLAYEPSAQTPSRNISIDTGGRVTVKNPSGRVVIIAAEDFDGDARLESVFLGNAKEESLLVKAGGGNASIEVKETDSKGRIDLKLFVPTRVKIEVVTKSGAVSIIGNVASANVKSDTGTIHADVPPGLLSYDFIWLASRPKVVSDIPLNEIKEKPAGAFQIKGKVKSDISLENEKESSNESKEIGAAKSEIEPVSINFKTYRGIILLNVSPNLVPSNLEERPLTEAARAIVRSGDSYLIDAIRRAAPKHFGEYAATLPQRDAAPQISNSRQNTTDIDSEIKRVTVQVTDINNRAVSGLTANDFEISERGQTREILSVENSEEPFNLVLLLDVSGSIENYVDFVRKAAREFLNTARKQDRIAIVTFNNDVKVLANLSGDREYLSETLDSFDSGGGTAYYDALAYGLVDTLRPLKGERTALVVLSDGDDNRSFLPFESLISSIQESGTLVYPLYVPSGLVAQSDVSDPTKTVDPMRVKYLTLTSKAQEEGERLAKISGGVYYPISRLSQLQEAYDDIVKQLRTAYTITYRSNSPNEKADMDSPRLRVRVKKEGMFVKTGPVSAGKSTPTSSSKTESRNELIRKVNFERTKVDEPLEITGEVNRISYQTTLQGKMKRFPLENFDINKAPGAFFVGDQKEEMAVSRWISPKRTRSYPYARVYDTLSHRGKRVAVIPVVKDEGLGGERDFLQWDTISLLNLLDVHVLLAYYSLAEKNLLRHDAITNQKLNTDFVAAKLREIANFKGGAREWNEKEVQSLSATFATARDAYLKISEKTGVYMHDRGTLDELIDYAKTPQRFLGFSRRKSEEAQSREFKTVQPKEALSLFSKAKITITNSLFGKYLFTVDETRLDGDVIELIEAKHSSRAMMPNKNDVKDGLVKMMLYTNMENVRYGGKSVNTRIMLRLTSAKLLGSVNSGSSESELNEFFVRNAASANEMSQIKNIFAEAMRNSFVVILEHGETGRAL